MVCNSCFDILFNYCWYIYSSPVVICVIIHSAIHLMSSCHAHYHFNRVYWQLCKVMTWSFHIKWNGWKRQNTEYGFNIFMKKIILQCILTIKCLIYGRIFRNSIVILTMSFNILYIWLNWMYCYHLYTLRIVSCYCPFLC